MEANLAAGIKPALPILINDFLAFCAARNLSNKSTKLYQIALNTFLDFTNCDPDSIDTRLLRRYIFHLQSLGLKSSTVHHYYCILKIFLGYLVAENLILENPTDHVPVPKKGKRQPHVLSESQAQALLDACPDYTWIGRRDKTAIFILLGSGLRHAELLSLNLYDIDLDGGLIAVTGKGDKDRTVPIDDDVIQVVRGWLDLRERILKGGGQHALFINRFHERMGKSFGGSVKRYARQAGFHCTPHVCRHTFATDWIRGSGDLQMLKNILGHSNISITEQYVHLALTDFKKSVNKYSITKRLRFDGRQMQLTDRP